MALEFAMAQHGIPRNRPALKATLKKKALAAIQKNPLLRDRYAPTANAKKATRPRGSPAAAKTQIPG